MGKRKRKRRQRILRPRQGLEVHHPLCPRWSAVPCRPYRQIHAPAAPCPTPRQWCPRVQKKNKYRFKRPKIGHSNFLQAQAQKEKERAQAKIDQKYEDLTK